MVKNILPQLLCDGHEAKYRQINNVSSGFILHFDFTILSFSALN